MNNTYLITGIIISLSLNVICLVGLALQWNMICGQGKNIKDLTKQVLKFLSK